MGGEPYYYIVKYRPEAGPKIPEDMPQEFFINTALQKLRREEFAAGRYNPVMPHPPFPPGPNSPAPGAQHDSIEEAFQDADADGTRSILDLDHLSSQPEFCAVCPLDDDVLVELYGTSQPTREMIEENMDFFEDIERGMGIYIVLYRDGQPDEILFAGYSFD